MVFHKAPVFLQSRMILQWPKSLCVLPPEILSVVPAALCRHGKCWSKHRRELHLRKFSRRSDRTEVHTLSAFLYMEKIVLELWNPTLDMAAPIPQGLQSLAAFRP
mmetsp:Transcript_82559/g.130006  ORF Transcript_82559/g.130006 Transcript_82559/m.130006 type:complete len:105 (+) Transcript_82559:707-1021(+)